MEFAAVAAAVAVGVPLSEKADDFGVDCCLICCLHS